MKNAQSIFVLLACTALVNGDDPKPTPPAKPRIVASEIKGKANDIIIVSAASAKGDVIFSFDKKQFPDTRAIQRGKELFLTTPTNGSYTVLWASIADNVGDTVTLTITGGGPAPPDPPAPVDPLVALTAAVAKLQAAFDTQVAAQHTFNVAVDARLKALEGPRPPPNPPADPFVAALQAAYIADGKPATQLQTLAAIYKMSPSFVANEANKTPSAVFSVVHTAIATALKEKSPDVITVLPNVRKAIGAELDKVLPLGPASVLPLDATMRATITAQFARVQKALEGVSP